LNIHCRESLKSRNFLVVLKEFPHISSVAVKEVLRFPITYLCGMVSQDMQREETKYRNRLKTEHDKRT